MPPRQKRSIFNRDALIVVDNLIRSVAGRLGECPNVHGALGGYVLHVDLEPVKELVSLQRRCANNLNQAAIHANSYGGLYPDELKRLQKDYADLWGPLSDLLAQISAIVTM